MNKITIAILSFCAGVIVVVFAVIIQKNIKVTKPDVPWEEQVNVQNKVTWFSFGYRKLHIETNKYITLYDEQTNLLLSFWSTISNKYNDTWYKKYSKELLSHTEPVIQNTQKIVTNLTLELFDEKHYSKYKRIWRNFYWCCPTVLY